MEPVPTENPYTNNHIGNWHSKLNQTLGKHHSNIHILLRYQKDEEADTKLTLRRARLGAALKPLKRKYCNLDVIIQRPTQVYDQSNYSLMEFLEEMSDVVERLGY